MERKQPLAIETIILKATKTNGALVVSKLQSRSNTSFPLFETFVPEVSADVFAPEVSAARTFCLQKIPLKDNNCQTVTQTGDHHVCEPTFIGTAQFEFDPPSDLPVQRIETVKTETVETKTLLVVECLVCHITVKKIDRHLKQHRGMF